MSSKKRVRSACGVTVKTDELPTAILPSFASRTRKISHLEIHEAYMKLPREVSKVPLFVSQLTNTRVRSKDDDALHLLLQQNKLMTIDQIVASTIEHPLTSQDVVCKLCSGRGIQVVGGAQVAQRARMAFRIARRHTVHGSDAHEAEADVFARDCEPCARGRIG